MIKAMGRNGIDDGALSTEQVDHETKENTVENSNTNDDDDLHQVPAQTPPTMTKDELIRMLSERHILQLTPEEDELLDPIERTVRYIIPIPKYYYWDVLKEQANHNGDSNSEARSMNDDGTKNIITSDQIPYSIKSWHTIIGLCESIGTWTNHHVAQPIASFTGLTGPRFHEVLNSMTPQEMRQSQRMVQERQLRDQIQRQV